MNLNATRTRNAMLSAANLLEHATRCNHRARGHARQYTSLILERTEALHSNTPFETAFDTQTRATLQALEEQCKHRTSTATHLDTELRVLKIYTDASEVLLLVAYLNQTYQSDGIRYVKRLLEHLNRIESGAPIDEELSAAARASLKQLRSSYLEARTIRSEEIDTQPPEYPEAI